MNPWLGRALFLALFVGSVIIRHPHETRSRQTKVAESRRGALEIALLALVSIAHVLLPVLSMTPLLSFADHELPLAAVISGSVVAVLALWLFHRSHADLGANWSMTLELREEHRLVTTGVYARIRHPMYAALFADALAQALLLPNWIAGPAFLVAFTLMFALRLRAEEKMMRDRFPSEYDDYARRTKRLIPGVW